MARGRRRDGAGRKAGGGGSMLLLLRRVTWSSRGGFASRVLGTDGEGAALLWSFCGAACARRVHSASECAYVALALTSAAVARERGHVNVRRRFKDGGEAQRGFAFEGLPTQMDAAQHSVVVRPRVAARVRT